MHIVCMHVIIALRKECAVKQAIYTTHDYNNVTLNVKIGNLVAIIFYTSKVVGPKRTCLLLRLLLAMHACVQSYMHSILTYQQITLHRSSIVDKYGFLCYYAHQR